MHPENIRMILADPEDRKWRLATGADEHTIDQLYSAWGTILWLWDNVPEASKALGGT